jgi:hypothetical protein
VRYQLRMQERPISMAAWAELMRKAGFVSITASRIVAEAGLVSARRPDPARFPGRSATAMAGTL